MLLSTIVKSVKRKSHRGAQGTTTDQITTDIIACVNEAVRDVSKLIPKRYWFAQETIALSAGTQATPYTASLASNCQESNNFWYTLSGSNYTLQKVDSDKEWVNKYWNVSQVPQQPLYYREIGPNSSTGYKQIEIFPMPNTTYTLNHEYYKTKGVDLTTAELASELPTIPDHVQDVVEKGALYYFLKGFDDGAGEIAKRDYEEAKLAMDISGDRNLDSDLRLRWNMMRGNLLPPGFRLD